MRIVTVKDANYAKYLNHELLSSGTVSGIWNEDVNDEKSSAVRTQSSRNIYINH